MKEENKCDEIARGQFSKITKNACLSGWELKEKTIARTAFTQPAIEIEWIDIEWKSCVFQIFLLKSIKAYFVCKYYSIW